MGHSAKEINDLLENSCRIRSQFVANELKSCFTALDVANYEVATGNMEVALRESRCVDKVIRVIRRFAGTLPTAHREKTTRELADIEERLSNLKVLIGLPVPDAAR